jgi:uncharacterized damage-inducible protein DinB
MDLRYPLGKFEYQGPHASEDRFRLIGEIEQAPARLREAVRGLNAAQLDTEYRPDGWTVRQVIYHLPDSHMNAYIRFKLGLTEAQPVIKAYDEARWARLADSAETPIEVSMSLLESLHRRWVILLRSLQPSQFDLKFTHPERGPMSLDQTLALYAWHGKHHVSHIAALRSRTGWDSQQ